MDVRIQFSTLKHGRRVFLRCQGFFFIHLGRSEQAWVAGEFPEKNHFRSYLNTKTSAWYAYTTENREYSARCFRYHYLYCQTLFKEAKCSETSHNWLTKLNFSWYLFYAKWSNLKRYKFYISRWNIGKNENILFVTPIMTDIGEHLSYSRILKVVFPVLPNRNKFYIGSQRPI